MAMRTRGIQILLLSMMIFLCSSSCSSTFKRQPANESSAVAPSGLALDLEKMRADVMSRAVDSANCHSFFQSQLENLKEERLLEIPSDRAKAEASKIMNLTWQNRLQIHRELSRFTSCRTELRQLFFRLRSIEDLAADRYFGVSQSTGEMIGDFQNQPVPLIDNQFYSGYWGPSGGVETNPVDFRSGDLMVTRGVSFFSAALSNIPDHPSQLDHFVLIHRDDAGVLNTIESYAQTGGVSTFPMNYALKNENARIMLLRPKDAAVGARAAQIMIDAVSDGERNPNRRIGYDYKMDLENPKKMTCSAVTYWGYRRASGDQFEIPEERSSVSPKLKQIFTQTGIKMGPMLTAGDIELDTRFELVLEFRDLRLVQDGRIRDAVEQMIFKWMKEKKYRLWPTGSTIAIDALIYPLRPTRLWPLVKRVTGSPDFPPDMPKGFLKTLNQINDVSDILYKRLHDASEKSRRVTGWGLTMQQMYDELEAYRQEDLKKCDSRVGAYAHFHQRFGARPCSLPKR